MIMKIRSNNKHSINLTFINTIFVNVNKINLSKSDLVIVLGNKVLRIN